MGDRPIARFRPGDKADPDAHPDVNSKGDTITPVEAVLDRAATKKLHAKAEEAQQYLDERAKRQAEPVRMEGLKPLPATMPRPSPGQIPSGPDALGLVPSVRRSIPAPYKRDRISAGRHGKTWGYLAADQVRVGDIVVDFGRVDSRGFKEYRDKVAGHDVLVRQTVLVMNPLGELREFDLDEQLRVFRVHEVEQDDAGT